MVLLFIVSGSALVIGFVFSVFSFIQRKPSKANMCLDGLENSDIKMENAWKHLELCNSASVNEK